MNHKNLHHWATRSLLWVVIGSLGLHLSACKKDEDDKKPGPNIITPIGIIVNNPAVRACDIFMVEKNHHVSKVIFTDSVLGVYQRWAPKVAISVSSKSDLAFSKSIATVEFVDGQSGSGDDFKDVEITCYDRLGNEVASPGVQIN